MLSIFHVTNALIKLFQERKTKREIMLVVENPREKLPLTNVSSDGSLPETMPEFWCSTSGLLLNKPTTNSLFRIGCYLAGT